MRETITTLEEWRRSEIRALELLQKVGDLRFNKGIELVFFRNDIYDVRPSRLIGMHRFTKNYTDEVFDIDFSKSIVDKIAKIKNLAPTRVDIGRLGLKWLESTNYIDGLTTFIKAELAFAIDKEPKNKEPKDVVLYGFGRIGRLAARRIIEQTGKGEQLLLKAIVLRPKMKDKYEEALKRASLLKTDSVHGDFTGSIDVLADGSAMTVNGNKIVFIYASNPSEIDYTEFGIHNALVIDNTGVWRDKNELSGHLRPGADAVILTAPGKGSVPNIVYGVNDDQFDYTKEKVLSAASCTTNAIVPVLHTIEQKYGIVKGHVETIHSYTNDQNLLDNFHKKPRRGRGAPINMVLTSTGAATAVSKVIPSLAGKLSGNAIRVPTPNVSMVILNLTLNKATSREELNDYLKAASLNGPLVEQIRYSSDTEFVSSNVIGMIATSVVDAPSTIVSSDGKTAIVYIWYDNEYGYTCQVVRLAKKSANVGRYVYY